MKNTSRRACRGAEVRIEIATSAVRLIRNDDVRITGILTYNNIYGQDARVT